MTKHPFFILLPKLLLTLCLTKLPLVLKLPCIILYWVLLLTDQNKGTICFHEWIGAAFHTTSLKSPLATVLWLLSSKTKITFFIYRYRSWKKSMITLQYSTRLPGNDPFWYHILWQSQPEAHFLQTPKYSCAETSFHWRCPVVLLNHSQAPLPSPWEKSAKATACLPRLWLTHGYDVTAQSRACRKQTEKQVLLSCFR